MAEHIDTSPTGLSASTDNSRVRFFQTLLLMTAVAALVAIPILAPALKFVMTIALAKGLAALGVALLLRAGFISLGHAMYFALGAYTVAFLSAAGVREYLLLLLAATLLSTLFGAVIGAFLARFRAIFFAMLSLAVSMVLYSLLSKLFEITGGTDGMSVSVPLVFGRELSKPTFDLINYAAAAVIVVVVCVAVARYLKSPLGEALTAIHTNEIRLEYLGISTWSVIVTGYTISAALAGLGGAIGVLAVGHALPEFAFWTESGHFVLTAVLGGTGSVLGPILGSMFIEIIHLWANEIAAEAWNMIMGVALLLVIFFLPKGIWSVGQVIRTWGQKPVLGERE